MIQDIASIVTAVAVIFVVFQLVGDRTSRHREFENLYVQRYWSLTDQLTFDPSAAPAAPSLGAHDRALCLSYLRLCEDEIDLRKQGYITDQTWRIWAEGIEAQTKAEPFLGLLAGLKEDIPSLHKFTGDGKDPLERKFLARWWTGLH